MTIFEDDNLLLLYEVIAVATMIAVAGQIQRQRKRKCQDRKSNGGSLPGQCSNRDVDREAAGKPLRECCFLDRGQYNQETGYLGLHLTRQNLREDSKCLEWSTIA